MYIFILQSLSCNRVRHTFNGYPQESENATKTIKGKSIASGIFPMGTWSCLVVMFQLRNFNSGKIRDALMEGDQLMSSPPLTHELKYLLMEIY